MFGLFKKKQVLDDAQLWMLAAGAPLGLNHLDSIDSTKVGMFSFACRSSISSQYGVEDHESAISTLHWLALGGGHSEGFPDDLPGENSPEREAVFEKYSAEFAKYRLCAFDQIRAISLARWCWKAKHISEQEMWQWMALSGKILQQTFSSWEELGRNWIAGYEVFRSGTVGEEVYEHLNWLNRDPESPWLRLAWMTPLPDVSV